MNTASEHHENASMGEHVNDPGPPPPGRLGRLPEEESDLFVYGTLLFPEIVRGLLGRVPKNMTVTAVDWRAAALPGRVYPVLVPHDGTVHGRLLVGLTRREWETIDAFEDNFYQLLPVTLDDGRTAWSYACTDTSVAATENWNKDTFARDHLSRYVTELVSANDSVAGENTST